MSSDMEQKAQSQIEGGIHTLEEMTNTIGELEEERDKLLAHCNGTITTLIALTQDFEEEFNNSGSNSVSAAKEWIAFATR